MVTLTPAARRRLRDLRDASGHSNPAVHDATCLPNGLGGLAHATIQKVFSRGPDDIRVHSRTLRRLASLYRGAKSVAECQRWILEADPEGCPFPAIIREEDRREWRAKPSNSAAGSPRLRTAHLRASVVALLVGAVLIVLARSRPRIFSWEIEAAGRSLVIRSSEGRGESRFDHSSDIAFYAIAPWEDDTLVYGLWAGGLDGGRVFAVDLGSSRVIWTDSPDLAEIQDVYGVEAAQEGAYRIRLFDFADLDGDGEEELIVHRYHDRWFPSFLTVLRRDGTRMGAYYNWGQIYDLHCEDIDQDGKSEILIAGTNNAECYQGATLVLLDDDHCHGAAVDALVGPDCPMRDSSLVRVVVPQFDDEFMRPPFGRRLVADEITVTRTQWGTIRLMATVGETAHGMIVMFDEDLVPLHAGISDALMVAIRSWPADLQQRFLDQDFQQAWLARSVRFGARAGT